MAWHHLGQEGWSCGADYFVCNAHTGHENMLIFHSHCSAVSPRLFSLQPQTNSRACSLHLAPMAAGPTGMGQGGMGKDGMGWAGHGLAVMEMLG